MVKSFKKKQKKKRYYLYHMIFKKILNCFFPSFNSKIETWVICEAQAQVLQWITSKSIQRFWALKKSKPNRIQQAQPNTQTHPPTTKTLITHKHTTHNPQTHNTQTLLWLYNRTQKKKKKNLLWVQACKTQGSTVCGQPNLKRQKQEKKERG